MKRLSLGLWLLCAGPVFGQTGAASSPQRLQGKIIVLDPGHAVLNEAGIIINPGARARRGAWERDVALNVAEKAAPLLEAQGAKVFMTRTADNPWRVSLRKQADNRSRAIFANVLRAHAYIRIHCDWNHDRRFKGFTTYYYRWGSRSLARQLHASLAQALADHRDNGIHRRSFVSITARMPSVLLEIGVLSHRPEGKEMAGDAYQSRVAQAIADGTVRYFSQS
jgi:N-acetylmuramoyl-L-alanine amidase